MYAKSCVFVNDTAYCYLKRADSILNSKNAMHYKDAQKTALLFEQRMKERGFYKQYKEEIEHFMTERYYCIYLKRCLAVNDRALLEDIRQAKETLYKMYPEFWSNRYIPSFVAEDILRMKMNDLGGMAALYWENNYKNMIKNDAEFCSEIIKEFYMKRKGRLLKLELIQTLEPIQILESIPMLKSVKEPDTVRELKAVKEKSPLYLYGDKAKKLALSKVLDELGIMYEEDKDRITDETVIILVNPGAESKALREFANHRVVNMEDYLNGYFDYAMK